MTTTTEKILTVALRMALELTRHLLFAYAKAKQSLYKLKQQRRQHSILAPKHSNLAPTHLSSFALASKAGRKRRFVCRLKFKCAIGIRFSSAFSDLKNVFFPPFLQARFEMRPNTQFQSEDGLLVGPNEPLLNGQLAKAL